jgi:hypothetical protein
MQGSYIVGETPASAAQLAEAVGDSVVWPVVGLEAKQLVCVDQQMAV